MDEENDGDEADEADEAPQPQANRQQLYTDMLAKRFIRYALSCEPRRIPIRRLAVKDQVLEGQGRYFRSVFPIAQQQLQAIFGMEMVEWPSRDETTMSVRERRKALKTQKATVSTAAAARADRFVLVSTLPDDYRASVFASIPTDPAVAAGKAIPPVPAAPDAAYMGLVTMIIALITLSGGALAHADLEKYLAMLYGAHNGPVRADAELLPVATALGDYVDDDDGGSGGGSGGGAEASTQHHDANDGTSTQGGTLQYLVRHGYLVRVVEAPTAAEARAGGGPSNLDGSQVTWHVGPRGRLEVGPAEVAAVVRHIYGPSAGADLERRLQSSLRVGDDGREDEVMQEG